MKIAILVHSIDDASGTSVVAMQQAALFRKAGCNVTLFTIRPNNKLPEVPVENLQPPLRLPVWRWSLMPFTLLPPPLNLALVYQAVRLFSSFDAVIAYDYPFSWFGYYAKRLYGLKYIWFLQGVNLPEVCDSILQKLYSRIQTYGLYRMSAANADVVATETDFLKEILKHRFGIESIVIQNTTHLSFNLSVTGNELRRKYHLGDEPLILYVDRLEANKGIETLLDSFSLVLEAIPEAKLMLIGKCRESYWERLKERFNSSIIYVNYVPHDEIAAFYAASTIFATCAVYEAEFSHTMVEAQAFAKPVVAFNVGAHKEVVRSGETGILIDRVGDAREFALALITLLSNHDLASSMGGKARQWAKQLGDRGTRDFQQLLDKIKG